MKTYRVVVALEIDDDSLVEDEFDVEGFIENLVLGTSVGVKVNIIDVEEV